MARYQLILAYDGTNYHGFQRQKNKSTIQAEVEKALHRLGWEGDSILSAGRTDTGVHATGQVAAFDLDWAHPIEDLRNALNAYLPEEISARSVRETYPVFHPRFDAAARTYRYQIFFDPVRNPLKERFGWRIETELSVEYLNEISCTFIGSHDFASFGSPMRKNGVTIRSVSESKWFRTSGWTVYQISANAFLYHMVRRIVYSQVMAASGKVKLEQLQESLNRTGPQIQGIAPANGLFLETVSYEVS